MVIGIDASRANLEQRTGTEWYAWHLLHSLQVLVPETDQVILYSKEKLLKDWGVLPANWSVRVLGWKPGLLWTQIRLSWELLWHRPDVLFVPAHTIPFIHPKTVLVAHDIGFEQQDTLYAKKNIGQDSWFGKILKFLVRLATVGKYGTSELDYHRWAMRYGVKHASKVITISEFSKQEILRTYAIAPSKLKVIWHGIPEKKEVKTRTPQATIPNAFILYIGRIELKKNLKVVIQALALIPEQHRPHFMCVGKDGLGAEEIKKMVAESDLTSWVTFTGWMAEAEVEFLRQQARAMILPSHYEGFGLPILEAWRAHVPMLASNIPSLREIGDTAVYFFEVNSPQSCAKAIEQVCTDQELRKTLITSGSSRLLLFSMAAVAQQTLQVIHTTATLPS